MTEIERRFLLGVDLAKAQDYTSFAAVEMTRKDGAGYYYISGLDRIRGVEYPKIEKRILEIYNQLEDDEPDVLDGPHLCMDSSGLGAPIRDYLKQHHVFTGKRRFIPSYSQAHRIKPEKTL